MDDANAASRVATSEVSGKKRLFDKTLPAHGRSL